jgi:Yip1 domain
MGGNLSALAREETMALMERAKNILFQPKQEWPVIGAEQTTIGGLYTGYIIPLAAIGPAASLIGWSVIGARVPFVGTIRVPFMSGLKAALIQYAGALGGILVLALIIDALAPTFGGQKNQIQAMKVAAYSATAAWVVGIFALIPTLAILGLLALYSLYLLYLGLPVLMKSPEDKAIGYTVVVCIVAIVLAIVIQYITRQFTWQPAMGMPSM